MKWFSAILLLYIQVLACMPCVDVPLQSGREIASQMSSSHDEHTDDEGCTPFCSCACCGVPVSLNADQWLITTPLQPASNSPLSQYQGLPFQQVMHSIWQPPKIG